MFGSHFLLDTSSCLKDNQSQGDHEVDIPLGPAEAYGKFK